MTDTVVAEGQVKFKDGKKWKSRWVVLRKPSPVADCLSVLVYRDRGEKSRGHRERVHLTLEGVCGLEPGQSQEGGAAYTLTLLCPGHSVALGFDTRDGLQAWDARLRYSLGEVHRFTVGVQPGTKLESGPASLHLCNDLLVLTRDRPPAVIGRWKLSDLRRYGAVPGGFVFEGGTRCGYWAGVFFLSCAEGEQISFLFDCIVRGLSPSRAPHGLRPTLPDLNANPSLTEERINHEASELERRLSMLSQSSRQSSTASTFSLSTSVAGDDGSSISSSSSSQSDASYGSRLPSWAEPAPRSHPSSESLSAPPTTKTSTNPDDCLYAAVMGGAVIRPSSKQTRPRGLHDSGRQSSLDSGIGIATGSQSSYSGSFTSCTGSLDTASQGGGEEFGSQLSLPPPLPPPPLPHPAPPSLSINTPDRSPAAPLSCLCPARTDASPSAAPWRPGEEYQVPSRPRYDSPRSLLLQSPAPKDPLAQGGAPESGKDRRAGGGQGPGLSGSPRDHRIGHVARSLSRGGEREAPPVDGAERCSSSARAAAPRPPTLLPGCQVCGGAQCDHCLNYITHEQWYSAKKRGCPQGSSPSGFLPALSAPDRPPLWREEGGGARAGGDGGDRGEPPPSSFPGPPQTPAPPPGEPALRRQSSDSRSTCDVTESPRRWELRLEEYGNVFTFPPGTPSPSPSASAFPFLDARPRIDSSANYVNIPVSLAAKASAGRELLYMELDLQEPAGPAPVSSPLPPARGGGSTRYAHIDIAATETAQRVGAEHAQGRQDRLEELEQRRRAAQN